MSSEAEISSDRPQLTVSADGETVRMETPLRYRIRPEGAAAHRAGGTLNVRPDLGRDEAAGRDAARAGERGDARAADRRSARR